MGAGLVPGQAGSLLIPLVSEALATALHANPGWLHPGPSQSPWISPVGSLVHYHHLLCYLQGLPHPSCP